MPDRHADLTAPGFDPLFNGLADHPMRADIGRRCRFVAPTCPAERDTFTVQTVQRDFTGQVVYRVVGDADAQGFGRPAPAHAIAWVD